VVESGKQKIMGCSCKYFITTKKCSGIISNSLQSNTYAHQPQELVNYFEEAKEIFRKIGFRKLIVLIISGWQKVDV
jgi:hypothetical protein